MNAIEQAAAVIRECDAILIGAGAGMGVDSGLPDFRGDEGFWNAYPPYKDMGLSFYDLANPIWFDENPAQAWGFYGHRLNLYRKTDPHDGFNTLLDWAECTSRKDRYFVFTSNVDGHFETAGFDTNRIIECHGAINHFQCSAPCSHHIWHDDSVSIEIDEGNMLAESPLPICHRCNSVARPNILMFGDASWLSRRTDNQHQRYLQWLEDIGKDAKLAVIEFGAGTAVPTVRYECQRRSALENATLIRINPRESQVPPEAIAVEETALVAINQIAQLL